MSDFTNIPALPYRDRQLIVVLPDEIVAAQREADEARNDESPTRDWKGMVIQLGTRFLVGGPTLLALQAAQEAYEAWARARANGINALQIKASEADQLAFPPGHPRDRVLYVAHPSDPRVYYTAATFHRMAFEHKFAEAINFLMHLGATKISVEHVTGWSTEFAASLSVPLSGGSAGGKLGVQEKAKTKLLFEASLPNNKAHEVPEGLVWFPHEPTWRSIAKGRLQFGLNEFSLSVNYEDDYGINAGLKLAAGKAGLDFGGSFEDHQATSWRVVGAFAPAS